MPEYGSRFVTPDVVVKYSDLLTPDEYRGNSVHKVQIILSDDLRRVLDEQVKSIGGSSMNGMRDYESETLIQFKTKKYTKEGLSTFPEVYDAANKKTTTVPFGGATVRLQLTPMMLEDKTVSFLLEKVQIIDLGREEPAAGAGFEAVDGGFVARNPAPEATPVAAASATDDDIPF